MKTAEPSPFMRGRIAGLVDRALRESGAHGVLPTPLDRITAMLGLELVEVAGLRPGVLGALLFEEQVVFVDAAQSEPRRRFTHAHELVHALCEWHHAALREDTAASLFAPVRDVIEAEANAGAAMLIFQEDGFRERAASPPCTLETVGQLAETFGASLHATLHHYAHSSPDPVAMLTVGRFPRKDAALPVWRRVESPAFRAAAGDALSRFDGGLETGSALRALVEDARTSGGATCVLSGAAVPLEVEARYNRHSFLVLARSRAAPIARVRLASAA